MKPIKQKQVPLIKKKYVIWVLPLSLWSDDIMISLEIRILQTTVSILKNQYSWVCQSAAQYIIS